VTELDKASEAWGVEVLRHEIKNITPPHDVLSAMENQIRAEREKRAVILTSGGVRDAKINEAEGQKQQIIKQSEASQQQQIHEANGQAAAILAVEYNAIRPGYCGSGRVRPRRARGVRRLPAWGDMRRIHW
jgi:regulator of protease activity HflC (stomatin/prohibitin superfamily)